MYPQQNPVFPTSQPTVVVSPDVGDQPPASNKRKKYIFCTIAGILLVFITVGVVFGLSYNHSPKTKTGDKQGVATNLRNNDQTATAKPPIKTGSAATLSTSSNQISSDVVQSKPVVSPANKSAISSTGSIAAPPPVYKGSLPSTVVINTSGGNNYYYAGDRQYANASGSSVELSQYSPSVTQTAGSKNHSLMELSVESSNGQQAVEFGWTVDPSINGDTAPHLFVFYWANGQPSACYNTCGFVSTNGSIGPGSTVAVGSTATYSIAYSGSGWYISYNGSQLGYFPESLWGGAYTQMNFVQVFGEVELSNGTSTQCVQMGNGIAGNSPGSAVISNFSFIGSSTAPALSPYATSPSPYSYGNASATGVSVGGSGSC